MVGATGIEPDIERPRAIGAHVAERHRHDRVGEAGLGHYGRLPLGSGEATSS